MKERLDQVHSVNERRCARSPVYGRDLLRVCALAGAGRAPWRGEGAGPASHCTPPAGSQQDLMLTLAQRQESLQDVIDR